MLERFTTMSNDDRRSFVETVFVLLIIAASLSVAPGVIADYRESQAAKEHVVHEKESSQVYHDEIAAMCVKMDLYLMTGADFNSMTTDELESFTKEYCDVFMYVRGGNVVPGVQDEIIRARGYDVSNMSEYDRTALDVELNCIYADMLVDSAVNSAVNSAGMDSSARHQHNDEEQEMRRINELRDVVNDRNGIMDIHCADLPAYVITADGAV